MTIKTVTQTVVLSLALASSLLASGLDFPVANPDGQAINPTLPQWGADIFAIPGSTWWMGFNDNFGDDCITFIHGDCDANDALAHVTFSSVLPGPLSGSVLGVLYYDTTTSDLDNDIRWVTLFPWLEPGQNQPILTAAYSLVHVYDRVGSDIFSTGDGTHNPDGLIHANVWTPEPGTFMLIGLGLSALALVRRRA